MQVISYKRQMDSVDDTGRIFSQGYKVFFSQFTSVSRNVLPFQRKNVSDNIFVDRIWVIAKEFSKEIAIFL